MRVTRSAVSPRYTDRPSAEITRMTGRGSAFQRDVPADELATQVVGRALAGRTRPATPTGQPTLVGQVQDVARALRWIAVPAMAGAIAVHRVLARAAGRL